MASVSDTKLRELWESFARSRDAGVRCELIGHYLPFAQLIAARVYGLRSDCAATFDDYLQHARIGLIEALDRFDAGRNVTFEAYSVHRIRGAILNAIASSSEVAAQREFWRTRMADRLHSMVAETGGNPQRASLQDLIDITISIALGLVLDESTGDPIDEAPQSNPYAAAELDQFSRILRSLVGKLPEREREVIRGHYFARLEFQTIAERCSLTRGRISQVHSRALLLLRQMLKDTPGLDRKL